MGHSYGYFIVRVNGEIEYLRKKIPVVPASSVAQITSSGGRARFRRHNGLRDDHPFPGRVAGADGARGGVGQLTTPTVITGFPIAGIGITGGGTGVIAACVLAYSPRPLAIVAMSPTPVHIGQRRRLRGAA